MGEYNRDNYTHITVSLAFKAYGYNTKKVVVVLLLLAKAERRII
jgi:hypothetical protein